MGQGTVFHSFSFNTLRESPDVEVLDYQYGSNDHVGTKADPGRVKTGEVFPAWGTAGAYPRGEFLFVKWRMKQSGEVHEDKVDLTRLLPAHIEHHGIHFVIRGAQLVVYLIPPPGVFPSHALQMASSDKRYADYLKQHQIYPPQAK